jgi:hypothetical protein
MAQINSPNREERVLIMARWPRRHLTARFLSEANLSATICEDMLSLRAEIERGCGLIFSPMKF